MPPRTHLQDRIFFQALLISLLVAASALPATPHDDTPPNHLRFRRRRLASSLPSPRDGGFSAAAHPANRDWSDAPDNPPNPKMYYQDLDDGSRQLIWAFDDTLARDVLAGRPQVWLHAVVEVQTHGELLFPFLEHYSRLGIEPDRMLFTLRHDPLSSSSPSSANAAALSLSKIQSVLNAFGADHRVWLGSHSAAAELDALLLATRRVPVRDWVLAVHVHEFADFGGLLAAHFLQRQELKGANWIVASPEERLAPSGRLEPLPNIHTQPSLWSQFPLACSSPPKNASKSSAAVVIAFRGYLRPGVRRSAVVAPEAAADYFGAPGHCTWSHSLHELTPYFTYWRYYKTPIMVGNAYLWRERQADDVIELHRFRWHARAPAENSSVQAGDEDFDDEGRYRQLHLRCKGLSAEELEVQRLLKSGEGLVGEGKILCEAGSKAAPRLLPLSKAAAEALNRALAELQ